MGGELPLIGWSFKAFLSLGDSCWEDPAPAGCTTTRNKPCASTTSATDRHAPL